METGIENREQDDGGGGGGGGGQYWAPPKHLLQAGSSNSVPLDPSKATAVTPATLGFTPTRLADSFGVRQGTPKPSLNTSHQLSRRLESPCLPRVGEAPCLNWSVACERRGGSKMVQSPSKAWAIIKAEDGKVLVCNSVLSSLLGHNEE